MEAKIEKLDHFGRGICYIDGKITFVPFALDEEKVDIDIALSKKNFNEAKLNKILLESANREKSKCPYFEKCGGCSLLHTTYEHMLDFKLNRVKEILRDIDIESIDIIKNEKPFNYRNKIELQIKNGKIGFFFSKSHDIIEIKNCLVTRECINDFIPVLNKMNLKNGKATLRCNFNDEILVSLKCDDNILILEDEFIKHKVVGVILNNKVLYGEDHFIDKVGDYFFEVSYDSFFQINPFINEKLFSLISLNVDNSKVLDLYSGVGTLSICASKNAKSVIGIEVVPNAIKNALKNARINKALNTEFLLGKVEDKIKYVSDVDTVIIDPPRGGIDDITYNAIEKINPKKIIFISCETNKFAYDLKRLSNNYLVKNLLVLDMFSYSYHCETFCVLERR